MRARVISGFFLLIALASPAFAADRQAEGKPSLDRILPEIRHHTPGTFYDAEGPFVGADGLAHYRIKWMTPDGRIVWFDADARTGRMLGTVPNPHASRFGGERYDDNHYDNDHNGGRGNSNHFGDWSGYDRGQDGRDWGHDRAGHDRDGGNWRRGGSGHDNSGRGASGRGRGDRH